MKQILLKTWLTMLCLLVFGSGTMWAENYATWTFASGTAGTNYPSNNTDFTATSGSCGESTFTMNGSGSQWNSTKGYAFTAITDMTVTVKLTGNLAAGSSVVFAADMYYNKASNAPMTGFNLTVSENKGSYVTTGLSATSLSLSTSSANKSVTYTTQTALKSGDEITLKYTQTGKAGAGQGYVGNITVDGPALTSGGAPSKTTPTLSFANPTYNATMGDAFVAPTLNNPQGVTVSYSSSATGVATVNATTGAVELVGAGTTTITASYDGSQSDTYSSNSASYKLVVKAAAPVFASLEELVAAELTSGTEVTVSFENVPIKSFQTVSSVRKGIYFDIQKGENDIEIYFNAEIPAEWAVGGTLSGTLTNCPWKLYSGTWELAPASGWAWSNLTYNAPANYAPAITTQPVSATYDFNASATNLTVAANGNPAPTYQWYSNITNSNENGTVLDGETNVSYKPSTATAGTFYYYCVATNSEGSATSDVATITVNERKVAALPFSFDGGKSDIDSKDGMSQTGLSSDYSSSPKLKFDSQGDNVVINFNEAAKKVTYTIKGNSTSGTYAFDVMESADGVDYTTVHSHTSITDATSYTDNLASTSRFVKFVYTTKASGNVALGKVSIIAASYREEPNLAFDKATYKFIAGKDMQVAATSKAGSTGAITYALTEGDQDAFLIDENTGDIVCETAGTYTVTATIAETADYYSRSTTCTVNVLDPIVGNSIIVAEADGGYYAMTTTCTDGYFTHKAIKKIGEKYVVNSLDDILFYTSTADGKTTIQSTANNEYVQATAAKKVSYTEDEYKWTNDGEKLTAANNAYGTLQYNTGSPRFTTYASKVGQYATIVDLANVVVGETATITIADACTDGEKRYSTYSNSSAWVVPANLTVSEVGVVDGKLYVENYKTSDVVPANTGVMVSAEKGGSYNVIIETDPELLEAAESVLGEDNRLRPSGAEGITAEAMANADADCEYFRLTMQNGTKIGFWWGAADGAAFKLAANKAYAAIPVSEFTTPTPAESNSRSLWFNNDRPTSIVDAIIESQNEIYNLQGQRINRLQQGVNIVNGRKVIR